MTTTASVESVLADGIATYLAVGGCVVDQILFYSSIPMGVDASGRFERSDNFDLDVSVPASAHRPAS